MRILISKQTKRPLKIYVPNRFALIIVKWAIKSKAKENKKSLTRAQKKQLSKLIKTISKNYKNYKLVEVSSSDSDTIEVYL